MIRLTLSDSDQPVVQALWRDGALTRAERDRVDMVLLSDAGWSPPHIGTHLGCHATTVRLVLTRLGGSGPAQPAPAAARAATGRRAPRQGDDDPRRLTGPGSHLGRRPNWASKLGSVTAHAEHFLAKHLPQPGRAA